MPLNKSPCIARRMLSEHGLLPQDPELLSFENGLEQVPIFNNYVLDYCNSLWRHKAFEESENTTLFKVRYESRTLSAIAR